MDDESKSKKIVTAGLGALGLGAVATAVAVPKVGLWIGLAIILTAVLIFGSYLLFRHLQARRKSRNFEGAVAAQSAGSSRSVSDPNRRAALDKLRQKFQSGLQEFKSRGKDIYKLPWYVIIGEPGSGKTEAIRHSGIEFPPGLQNELQGAGGTINMDWWFTNRSVIIDTAGAMIFNELQAGENPEWIEFLRLLKKSRQHCPVNGLFLVLSIESLIKDSSENISRKASRLAQQLDLIQRTLDVRFPVYLLVTKCDLLAGFKEFFDNIDDPLLQHQIFGWSNPDELDSPFRPELVSQHLKTVADRLRRRRLALLREGAVGTRMGDTQFFVSNFQPGTAAKRRLDEVDLLYALPESVMRLAPRLQRYLETIFVAGEWSSKPVFLRGIYFTSSMREGQALDEAAALALGVPVDQLPEDRMWDKNRAFFMRDLFMEKVFRESGLVTRATNTGRLVRQRRWLVFGSISVALILLLTFALLAYRSLNASVGTQLAYWQAGATNWVANDGFPLWQPEVVKPGTDSPFHFVYNAGETVPGARGLTMAGYQDTLLQLADKGLPVNWVFWPMMKLTASHDLTHQEKLAQELMFEGGVLRPLVYFSRQKMKGATPLDAGNPLLVAEQRNALLSLIQLEADGLGGGIYFDAAAAEPARYLANWTSYLCETNVPADTNLADVFRQTYAKGGSSWPPANLLGGKSLAENQAINQGLQAFRTASESTQQGIKGEVDMVNHLADALQAYRLQESVWLAGTGDRCGGLQTGGDFYKAWGTVDQSVARLRDCTNYTANPLTNLTAHYQLLQDAAMRASGSAFQDILAGLPGTVRTADLFVQVGQKIDEFKKQAGNTVLGEYYARTNFVSLLDQDQLAAGEGGEFAYARRWELYQRACALAGSAVFEGEDGLGKLGDRVAKFQQNAEAFGRELKQYNGPLAGPAAKACGQIASDAQTTGQQALLQQYSATAARVVDRLFYLPQWLPVNADPSSARLARITADLNSPAVSGQGEALRPVGRSLLDAARRLYQSAGFPVTLDGDAGQPMPIKDLVALRNASAALIQALADPGWQAALDASGQARAKGLALEYREVNKLLVALVDGGGATPTWQLVFLPPKDSESADVNIISHFRQALALVGNDESGWQELATHAGQPSWPMFRMDQILFLNQGLQLSFRTLATDANPQKVLVEPDWALVRLINSGQAQTDDGIHWRVGVKLRDDAESISGQATFEMTTSVPLPKPADWPKK